MSVPPPSPPSGPTAIAADPESDDEPNCVEWAQEEFAILQEHLEEFRGKSKAARGELLNNKVVPKMKKVYKGNDWKQRKRV